MSSFKLKKSSALFSPDECYVLNPWVYWVLSCFLGTSCWGWGQRPMGSFRGRQMVPILPPPPCHRGHHTLLSHSPFRLAVGIAYLMNFLMKPSLSPITSNWSLHQILLAPITTSISLVSVYVLAVLASSEAHTAAGSWVWAAEGWRPRAD